MLNRAMLYSTAQNSTEQVNCVLSTSSYITGHIAAGDYYVPAAFVME